MLDHCLGCSFIICKSASMDFFISIFKDLKKLIRSNMWQIIQLTQTNYSFALTP